MRDLLFLTGNREGFYTIHQVHSNTILLSYCKDGRHYEEVPSKGHNIDQYSQQMEWTWGWSHFMVFDVIKHYFHSSFSGPFWPNFFTFLNNTLFFFLCLSFLCFIMLMTTRQGHNLIVDGIPGYLFPTLAVGPPHDLLGYRVPKTVHLQLNHQVLHQ